MFKRLTALLVCFSFSFSNLQYANAQDFSVNQLPVPGTMVWESAPFAPLALKGLVVNPQKPLEFQFIVDTGKGPQDTASIKDQSNQLVKYFLAGLTIPEGDLWVNLSPYEKNRMVPEALGQTDLGRDLLAQDYILKQLTASLIYPEKDLGKEFWSRVYAKAQQQFGTTNVPVNTFNKVWILPDQAQVFENVNAAYVTKATLKVMLDKDYLALKKHTVVNNGTDSIGSQIVRAIILPEIEKEVNDGKNFAPLRQIYQALILAKWYKETIQNGLLDAIYTNKNKVAGVNLNDPAVKEQIYERYLKAYKKGAFNYIKEDSIPDGHAVPRKYFSGGFTEMGMKVSRDGAMSAVKADGAMIRMDVALEEPKDAAMNIDPVFLQSRETLLVAVLLFEHDVLNIFQGLLNVLWYPGIPKEYEESVNVAIQYFNIALSNLKQQQTTDDMLKVFEKIISEMRQRLDSFKTIPGGVEDKIKEKLNRNIQDMDEVLSAGLSLKSNLKLRNFFVFLDDIKNLVPNTVVLKIMGPQNSSFVFDKSGMLRVFGNLFKNAIESMPNNRGTITVSADELPGGETVRITVADTGEGLTSEQVDTFNVEGGLTTTKESGHGLGLKSVSQIIKVYGGTITVESRRGESHGTVFTILLPAKGPASDAAMTNVLNLKIISEFNHYKVTADTINGNSRTLVIRRGNLLSYSILINYYPAIEQSSLSIWARDDFLYAHDSFNGDLRKSSLEEIVSAILHVELNSSSKTKNDAAMNGGARSLAEEDLPRVIELLKKYGGPRNILQFTPNDVSVAEITKVPLEYVLTTMVGIKKFFVLTSDGEPLTLRQMAAVKDRITSIWPFMFRDRNGVSWILVLDFPLSEVPQGDVKGLPNAGNRAMTADEIQFFKAIGYDNLPPNTYVDGVFDDFLEKRFPNPDERDVFIDKVNDPWKNSLSLISAIRSGTQNRILEGLGLPKVFKETVLSGKTILLVDDDKDFRTNVRYALDFMGAQEVVEASDGKEAFQILKESPRKFDLVLTDLLMLKMNGDALLKEMNKLPNKVPAVIWSSEPKKIYVKPVPGEIAIGSKSEGVEKLLKPIEELFAEAKRNELAPGHDGTMTAGQIREEGAGDLDETDVNPQKLRPGILTADPHLSILVTNQDYRPPFELGKYRLRDDVVLKAGENREGYIYAEESMDKWNYLISFFNSEHQFLGHVRLEGTAAYGDWVIHDFHPYSSNNDPEMIKRYGGSGIAEIVFTYLIGAIKTRGGELENSSLTSWRAFRFYLYQRLFAHQSWPAKIRLFSSRDFGEQTSVDDSIVKNNFFDNENAGELTISLSGVEGQVHVRLTAIGKEEYRILEIWSKQGKLFLSAGDKIKVEFPTGNILFDRKNVGRVLEKTATNFNLTGFTDLAMNGIQDKASTRGGIDLNQIKVKRTGHVINVQFDPAQLSALEQGGFEGFTPVITGFQYIKSPFSLLGINTLNQPERLAKV